MKHKRKIMKKDTVDILKRVSAMLAGTFISVLIKLIIDDNQNTILYMLFSILFFISSLFGFNIVSEINNLIGLIIRERTHTNMIAVINEYNWNTSIATWTDISTYRWLEIIRTKKYLKPISKRFINVTTNWNKYYAVLNPYGGMYPEKNDIEKETLNKIFKYVADGGIFINVADIPGYWYYDNRLLVLRDSTPITINDGKINRYFILSPFSNKLDLQIWGGKYDSKYEWELDSDIKSMCIDITKIMNADRVVVIEKNIVPYIICKYKDIKNKMIDVTPLFEVPYGKGKFIISLYKIENDETISNIISRKLQN
jgi:hypothetical protein